MYISLNELRQRGTILRPVTAEDKAGNLVEQGMRADSSMFSISTLMRISEFCGLTMRDIDLKNRVVNIDHQLQRGSDMKLTIQPTKSMEI